MKKNIIYKGLLLSACSLAMLGMTSCDDFLTIHPSNQITEEEFWEDQSDLQSAVRGCYKQFLGSGNMEKVIVWGECRSDNFDLLSESWDDMKDLMNANLLETNSLFDWSSFYTDINFCNKVLEYGPKVIQRDASFTTEDWKPVEAEMKALRALNMFYLVRSFRDVPLDFSSIGTDREARAHAGNQVAAEVVLDSIINDVDRVKDNGMKRYNSTAEDKGRFTKESIYTLLADMYLWRAAKNASADSVAKYGNKSQEDYQKVITLCDAVLDMYLTRYKEANPQYAQQSTSDQDNPYFLIRMKTNGSTKNVSDEIYRDIFISGNSSESIFEFQYDGSSNKNTVLYNYRENSTIGLYRAVSSTSGLLQAASPLQTVSKALDNTSGVYSQTDIRRWENMIYTEAGQRVFPIAKYCQMAPEFKNLSDNTEGTTVSSSSSVAASSNWILYRISDVLLMKAEAISRLEAPTEEQLETAFNNVTTILYRSNPTILESDKLKFNDYSTPSQLFSLVMRERRREFFGEGKRWFDLVRMAEYEGKTTGMLNLLLTKYATNTNAVKAKLSSMNSLYSPVYETEIKVNPRLHQNPAWEKEKTISRN